MAEPLAWATGSSKRPIRLMKWSRPPNLKLTWRAPLLSLTLGGFFSSPLPCMRFGLRADTPKSQAGSADQVALRSPRRDPVPFGLASGLTRQKTPEHPWLSPSKPLPIQGIDTPCLTHGVKLHHIHAVMQFEPRHPAPRTKSKMVSQPSAQPGTGITGAL